MNIEPEINAWLGLFAWHAGKDQRKRGGDGERWHQAWMDTQLNNTMRRQTVSLSMACHLLHRDTPSGIAHGTHLHFTCTHTQFTCKRSLNDSCWSSRSPFSLHMSHEFFKSPFFNLFHPLLQLALLEEIRDRDGKG